jgi:SSS family solute:Na+ symporter
LIVYHWIHEMKMAPPLADRDQAFPFALAHLAPGWGLRGIILAGFLAAVMSSISALANSTATLFALDVYRKLINPAADDLRTVRIGQIAALCALIVAAVVAPSVRHLGGIFQYFQTGVTYLSTPFISALFLGVLWKRTNYAGGLFAVLGGLVIQIAIALGLPAMGYPLHWLYLAAIAQAITMIGAAIVSLATPAPPRAHWEPFQWNPGLLARYDQGGARPWYQRLKVWYVIFAAVSIYLYWRFW